MKASVKQINLMAHTLGGKNPKKWYRNYFVASEDHGDYPDLVELEKEGAMERVTSPSFMNKSSITFIVTDKGKKFFK